MVFICDTEYPSNSKYESNFELYPYPLSSFQKYAIEAILEGQHVLVTAHTGSGKTLPAEFAIQYFAKMGKKVIYTSPIKALSLIHISEPTRQP
jgi:superfamily II RNA helicase